MLNLLDDPELSACHMAAHYAVVVMKDRADGTPCIVDIKAPKMPKLEEVLMALGDQATRAEVHFPRIN